MIRLKDRNKQIPFGLKWREAHTGWQSSDFSSFDTIVRGVISNRMGNPAQSNARGLALDYDTVAREVDYGNALMCQQAGWHDYILNDSGIEPPPSPKAFSPQSRLKAVAAGASVIIETISKDEAVGSDLANKRAKVCAEYEWTDPEGKKKVGCPFNEKGDWLAFFTVPVSEAIRKALGQFKNMNLSTAHDANLHVCGVCSCPLKLKVHFPHDRIVSKLDAQTRANLPAWCWIQTEQK